MVVATKLSMAKENEWGTEEGHISLHEDMVCHLVGSGLKKKQLVSNIILYMRVSFFKI